MSFWNRSNQNLAFTVPLTARYHRLAEQYKKRQSDDLKGDRVYRNTLAICAVNFYCQCMGIQTDWDASDSTDAVMQTLKDTADLALEGIGKVECRPVIKGEKLVRIPDEVRSDRMGYIAVQLSKDLKTAKPFGFKSIVRSDAIPLREWQPLDAFLHRIDQLQPVCLEDWFCEKMAAGWEVVDRIEAMLWPPDTQPRFAFRSSPATRSGDRGGSVERGKMLNVTPDTDPLALFVGFKPVSDIERNVWVQAYAAEGRAHLPENLHLSILDNTGTAVMEAKAHKTQNVQLEFGGDKGERFQVRLALGDEDVLQTFEV